MDFGKLRKLIKQIVLASKDSITHGEMPSFCLDLGLAAPVTQDEMSKAERLSNSVDRTEDKTLLQVANLILCKRPLTEDQRFELQEILWSDLPVLRFTKKSRREITKAFDSIELFVDSRGFDRLITNLFKLGDDDIFSFVSSDLASLRKEIERHVYLNPGDWTVEYVFERLGAFEASDHRFLKFLEGLVSSDVRPDEVAQRNLVSCLNPILKTIGGEFYEAGEFDGYPVFRIAIKGASLLRPKNIIFASSVKPDLRLVDAINNHIEIVSNADKVLVYDSPLTNDGLKWRDLQQWFKGSQNLQTDDEAKRKLYHRLLACLPDTSPPQQSFFKAFHTGFGDKIPNLPALLPEVWMHWDPKTVQQRGAEALFRQRMDFLMLLPNGHRIVMEIDGKQHFADENGHADVKRYSEMVAADRDLKLAGYEVFRFGSLELLPEKAPVTTKLFFESLFARYGIMY